MSKSSAASRIALALAALAALASPRPASAHFSWVVPAESGVRLFLSETPRFDAKVDGDIVAPAKLSFQSPDGAPRALTLRRAANEWVAETGGPGTVFGTLDLGVTRRGEVPHVLVYYPKAIAGDPFGRDAREVKAPVELFVTGGPGAARVELRADGRPVPNAELTIVSPDHSERKMRTGEDGRTEVLTGPGRYGVWGRHWVDSAGERDGAVYKQIRRYATLVFDLPGASAASAPASVKLPRAVASFGAAANGGFLYVYGGHVAKTHEYSTGAVTGAFHRLNVAKGAWEELPAGPSLQGTNLAAHADRVFRVGGMRPENAPGQPSITRSVAAAAGFDPAAGRWEELPPLSTPRSSHDLALVGDDLYVLGGWNMRAGEPAVWADTMEVLDVRAKPLRWESVPQPIQRRAFVTAVRGRLIYVIGGLDPEGKVLDRVDVYDTGAGTWSQAPALPHGARNGFAPAACTLDNRVYVSLGDGGVYVLDDVAGAWHRIATTSARVAHRMVPDGDDRLLLLGGAGSDGPLDVVESVDVRTAALARTAAR